MKQVLTVLTLIGSFAISVSAASGAGSAVRPSAEAVASMAIKGQSALICEVGSTAWEVASDLSTDLAQPTIQANVNRNQTRVLITFKRPYTTSAPSIAVSGPSYATVCVTVTQQ